MVTSQIDGRLRIRDEELKDPETAEGLKEELLREEGVRSVRTNSRIGSLLILYDDAVIGLKNILSSITAFLNARLGTAAVRKATHIGLTASLALSLAAVVLDATGLHAAAGLLFLFFVVLHVFRNQRMLFA